MRRWLMLALGTAAQTSACLFAYGIPYLAPELRSSAGLSLTQVGLLVACPTAGLVLALVAWGAAADRFGERVVIGLGLGLGTAVLACAAALGRTAPPTGTAALGAVFVVAGAASASVHAASGRLVLGWFSVRERGLAMGLRQTSTPLGMGLAALLVPPIAERWGVSGAVVLFAAVLGVNALLVAVLVTDPPRHAPSLPVKGSGRVRSANPYRSPALWRIHAASTLLVLPQFAAAAFALVFLIDVRHWDPVGAGRLLAGAQVLGALGRIAAGRWSDAVGSRLRPMRLLAFATAGVVALTAAGAARPTWASDVVLVIACGITASTNGLSYTATAELAGPAWTGKALGVQNTGQNLTAALAPPLVGALITAAGYPYAFAVAAGVAGVAAFVVPVACETVGVDGGARPRGGEARPVNRRVGP